MKLRLITVTLFLMLPGAINAQPSNALAEAWVGTIETKDKTQFITISFSETSGQLSIPLDGLTVNFSSVRWEGSRLWCEIDQGAVKARLTGTQTGDELVGEAETSGTKGVLHLVRSKYLPPDVVAGYAGAYRFADGGFLLIDHFADLPNMLVVTDSRTDEVRAIFPTSDTQFCAGSGLFVPYPRSEKFVFRKQPGGTIELRLTRRHRREIETARRIPISQEEVHFNNGDVKLAGTLLMPPPGPARHPAIVFTHGGGPAVRELFWGLGYLFAARGFAVLTYDKRGAGHSTGNWREASFEDLADDAVAGAKFLASRPNVAAPQIGFWGLSQGGWIAPLAASRLSTSAFAIAISGGGLSPAEQELFDSSYELRKAGFAQREIEDALAFQRLKNEVIRSGEPWDEYTKARLVAKEQKWFRVPGIDVRGPEKRDDRSWANWRRFYLYNPAPALRGLKCPLLTIFGELDTPEGVKANVRAIRSVLDSAGKRSYELRVYRNGRHNLMEVPRDHPEDFVRIQRFVPGLFAHLLAWTQKQVLTAPRQRWKNRLDP
jgi:uncharacterized protein